MLSKSNLDIAALAAKDVSRFNLNGLCVTPSATMETDGHQLVIVTTPKNQKAEEFPTMEGSDPATDEFTSFVLPTRTALDVSKSLPTRGPEQFRYAAISAATNVNGMATLYSGDTGNQRVFVAPKCNGTFPDVRRVIPKRTDAKFRIAVNAELLAKVLQQAAKFRGDAVRKEVELSFTDSLSAIRIDAKNPDQHFLGLVMPVRTQDYVEKGIVWSGSRPDGVEEDPEPFDVDQVLPANNL